MLKQSQEMYATAETAHKNLYIQIQAVKAQVSGMTSTSEMADACLALQQTIKYLEDALKVARDANELATQLLCVAWLRDQSGEPIRTEYCTASPDVKHMAALPTRKRDPEGFAQMMTDMGLPRELWNDEETEAVRPHWPGMVEYINKRLRQGLPLPAGVDMKKTYNVYKVTVRRKKGVLE